MEEPFLYDFVGALCRTIGAPLPRIIRVDCNTNASAGFHEGTAGMLGGRRVLTIGLPLAAGLSLAEFTGVLAHELGHFAQGAGTRLTFVIRAVNGWFGRVIVHQLAWDTRLGQVRQSTLIHLVVPIVRYFVRLTRRMLAVLHWISSAMTASFMRQLEWNADAFQAAIVGSDCFASAMRRGAVLRRGAGVAQARVLRFWGEHRLMDDIAGLIIAEAERLPAVDSAANAPPSPLTLRPQRFATHPPDDDRIAAANAIRTHRPFVSGLPASVLFNDFPTMCKKATWQHFVALGGKRVRREHLVSVKEFLGSVDADVGHAESLRRFFQNLATIVFPVPIHDFRAISPILPESVRDEIIALRDRVVAARDDGHRAFLAALDALRRIDGAEQAEALLRAGFTIKAQQFKLTSPTLEGCRQATAAAVAELELQQKTISGVIDALGRRLQLGLACVGSSGNETDSESGDLARTESDRLVATARSLGQVMARHLAGAASVGALNVLLANAAKGGRVRRFQDLVQGMVGRIWKSITQIRDEVAGLPYPFEDLGGPMPLSRHLVPMIRGPKDMATTLQAHQTLSARLPVVYFRVLGRLAEIASMSERALGLEPLPEPPQIGRDASPKSENDRQAPDPAGLQEPRTQGAAARRR